MDAATSEAPPPTEQQIDEATQALLSRNATIIHTLIRECACHDEVQGPSAFACSPAMLLQSHAARMLAIMALLSVSRFGTASFHAVGDVVVHSPQS